MERLIRRAQDDFDHTPARKRELIETGGLGSSGKMVLLHRQLAMSRAKCKKLLRLWATVAPVLKRKTRCHLREAHAP
eukprot:15431456-Alexandrium_andersonii.AAC.1